PPPLVTPLPLSFLITPTPRSTLSPYTTLFRSSIADSTPSIGTPSYGNTTYTVTASAPGFASVTSGPVTVNQPSITQFSGNTAIRSENHTSEHQSHSNLVRALLLEITHSSDNAA